MLSIIYITCNRSQELLKSILSCESHVTIEHEYVIIDNNSNDNTPQIIEKLRLTGLNIVYCYQKHNLGVSGGRNEGIKSASGDICYFIDDDAVIVSDGMVLDKAYKYMNEDKSISAMGTDCYDTEKKIQLVGLPIKNSKQNSWSKIRNYIGCSHFIRKSAVDGILYPNNLIYGSEELYAGLSFYTNGGQVVQYPILKIQHNPSKHTRESYIERKRHGHVNTYVIKKYFLPFPYNIISTIVFFIRIIRFEKFSPLKIINDIKLASQRYKKIFNKKASGNQIRLLIKMFGVKNII